MIGIHVATFQVCAPGEGAGPAFKYRRPEQTVYVLAERPEQVGGVIAENVRLQPGEVVEIMAQRQLEAGRKVFQEKDHVASK
jgi:hypothetical protein